MPAAGAGIDAMPSAQPRSRRSFGGRTLGPAVRRRPLPENGARTIIHLSDANLSRSRRPQRSRQRRTRCPSSRSAARLWAADCQRAWVGPSARPSGFRHGESAPRDQSRIRDVLRPLIECHRRIDETGVVRDGRVRPHSESIVLNLQAAHAFLRPRCEHQTFARRRASGRPASKAVRFRRPFPRRRRRSLLRRRTDRQSPAGMPRTERGAMNGHIRATSRTAQRTRRSGSSGRSSYLRLTVIPSERRTDSTTFPATRTSAAKVPESPFGFSLVNRPPWRYSHHEPGMRLAPESGAERWTIAPLSARSARRGGGSEVEFCRPCAMFNLSVLRSPSQACAGT